MDAITSVVVATLIVALLLPGLALLFAVVLRFLLRGGDGRPATPAEADEADDPPPVRR